MPRWDPCFPQMHICSWEVPHWGQLLSHYRSVAGAQPDQLTWCFPTDPCCGEMSQKMYALLEQLQLPIPDCPLFSRDLWLQAGVYPPAVVRNSAGLSGREGGGRMRLSLLGNPAGLHLLLRASQCLCTNTHTSVSCVSDNSVGLLCGLWQRSWH